MGKKRLIFAATLLASVFAILTFLLLPRDPVYQGKPLTAWLDQYNSNHLSGDTVLDQQAEAALRHLGTNIIPACLKMLSSHPSSTKSNLLAHIPKSWSTLFHIPSVSDYKAKVDTRRSRGSYGLIALGPDAKSAVPALIALLDDPDDRVRYLSVFAIRCLGPVAHEALPRVIKSLNDPEFTVQDDAVAALGTIRADPEHVVPILLDFLAKNPSDQILRQDTMVALGQFGTNADSAVPVLLVCLRDPDSNMRNTATRALGDIHSQPGLVVIALANNLAFEREKSVNNFYNTLAALDQYGPAARSAVPILLQFAGDADPDVHRFVISLLKKIDPDAAVKAGLK